MNFNLSYEYFALFNAFFKENCGIYLCEEKMHLVESRLGSLMQREKIRGFSELYNKLTAVENETIMEKAIDAITTNETMWFRDKTPWQIMEDIFLPAYIEELRTGKKDMVRIWSSACSTGQEPYSTAMCIDNYLLKKGINDIGLEKFQIIATDISSSVLAIASEGKYNSISIERGLEECYREKYFKHSGNNWYINDKIKSMVSFDRLNVCKPYSFPFKFDIVLCRYLLIYFSEEFKKAVLKRIVSALNKDGVFFVGASEVIGGYSEELEMNIHRDGIYYCIK